MVVVAPGTGTPTGNVTVSDGTDSCTSTAAAGTCSITFTTPGAKSLTATYAGDANFLTSTSAAESHTVSTASTTTTISSDLPDPSLVGEAVTINYSVVVVAPGGGIPTGNVTVSDGTDNCTGTVAAGTCSITFTTAGSKSLTATYAGDANFLTSTSAAESHTVSAASTTTTISSDLPDPSVVGEAVTINYSVVVVAPGTGTPTGNVTVSDGTDNCTGTAAAGTCSITFTTAGVKSLTATYAGDANFTSSASTPPTDHTVNPAVPADTTTTITSDLPDPSVVGQPVPINYSVVVVAPGSGTPTGNVTVSDGTDSCTDTVAAGTCSITFTTAGSKSLTATYAGDANFLTSTSAAESHTVSAASTTTAISSDLPDPSVVGEAVTINYSVVVVAPGTGTPTGNVSVSDGTDSCTSTAAAGTCSITFTTAGAKSITATYAGDANFLTSTSAAESHTVSAASTTTTISSDLPDPSLVGEAVTINYSVVVVAPGTGTPTGNVTVSDGTDNCTGTAAAGTCSITFTTAGVKSLTATYAGDANFTSSASTPPTDHTVNPAVPADTTTTITSDLPDPSVVGQPVPINYSVVVVAPGSGTPTGNVTVSDGTDSCTGTVTAGTCSITFTTAGVKSLTATYAGDANFNGSVSTPATHAVDKADTTTTITITSDLTNHSVVGQPITISYSVAVVAPGSGTPTGDVTVLNGSESCLGTVAGGSCSITFTAPGAKTLVATYTGDANFNSSVSTPVTAHMVDPADTTTTISSDLPDPSLVGEAVPINYSVVAVAPGSGTPTGNVTVSDGTDSCTGTTAAGTCSITFTTAGEKSLIATYASVTNFNGSASTPPTAHTVNPAGPANTTTTISSDLPDPSLVGEAVTINYSVVVVAPGTGTPTGNVTVSDGTDSCTGTVAAGTCSITFTTAGSKSLTATYAGDANFLTSTSAAESHTVSAASTTTAISSDLPDPSLVGEAVPINYSVVVVAPGTGTPTGNVTVSDGTDSCTGTVAAGTCSITFTTAGSKSLTATYAGDANFLTSTSAAESHTVSAASTTTTISSDLPDPSLVGEAVTINYSVVVVASGSGTPIGNVTVSDGTDSCNGTAAAGTCSITFTTAGSKSLTATYAGDTNFNGSSSTPPTDHTVNPAAPANTTTTITSDQPNPSVVGEAVTFNYSVAAVVASGTGTLRTGTPTGNVTVSDGTDSCTGTVAAGTCSIAFTTSGNKKLTATYAGDANFNSSTSSPAIAHNVQKADTTTAISSDLPDPSVVGEAVTINYSVAVVAPGGGTPTGNVIVSDGADNCTGTAAAGTCSITFTTAGTKALTATYAGDANFTGSASTPPTAHTVIPAGPANTTTTITSHLPDPSVVGQSVAVSVNVTGTGGTPTGTVAISGATSNCTITLSSGSGSCNVVFNSAGVQTLTAVYSGDSNFASSSDTKSHTVSPTPTLGSTTVITGDNPDPTTPGQPVVVSVKVSGSGPTPTGTVDINGADTNCTITLASGIGSCNAVFNTAGPKTLTATYNGDVNYLGSSGNASHTVNRTVSTTTITEDIPDPSAPYQTVTVSVTVTGAGAAPTGTVAISISGVSSVCTITLASGTGSCNVVFTAAGTFTISANYSGDGNYLGSSAIETHIVGSGKIASTTEITGTVPDPSIPGETVAVNVTVSGADTLPTGTVAISGANTNCSITLVNGSGNCNVVFNTAGNKPLKAIYGGNAKYAGSMGSRNHNVHGKKADTVTTITSDLPDPSMVGQPVTIQYSVTAFAPGQGTPTGNVTVSDGTDNCTGTVAGGTCSITFTTPGVKALTATYAGDANFNGSASTPPTAHTVNPANPNAADTTTTITAHLPNPSVVGQPVTINYSVAVVAPGVGTPTGNVTVSDGTDSCTGAVAAGTCSITFTAPGVKALTATYAGDANFNGSASTPPTDHMVNKADTVTTITSDLPDPSMVSQPVTIQYSVTAFAPGQGTPTGNVTVSDGTDSCTSTIAAGNCPITFTTPGVKALTATYAGDANFNGSASTPPTDHTVNPANPNAANTTTTITTHLPNPSVVGQPVTINYSVAVVAPGTGTPTGSVTVSDGTDSCTGTVAGGTCSITFTTPGVKALTATYAGDANFNGSASTPPTDHTVNKASTTTTITSDLPDPSMVGQPVTIQYSIAVVDPGTGTPTGDVTVSDGTDSCTGTVAAGNCSIAFATSGAKSLTAAYSGDANFNGSFSSPATPHMVNQANLANTTTTINSDLPDPSTVGQPVTIKYSVAVIAPGAGTPTGNVTVSDGSQSCVGTVAAGGCSIAFATPGAKSLTATYAGDANFNGSISTPPTPHMVRQASPIFTGLVCLVLYFVLVILIAAIALVILIVRRRRGARRDPPC